MRVNPNVRLLKRGAAFTSWVRWEERERMPCVDQPGVYLLAHFSKRPTGTARATLKEIIYIGKTSRTFRKRWNEFNRSASHIGPEERRGHSAARRYWRVHCGKIQNLWVAACVTSKHEAAVLEKELISAFASQWGRPPEFNWFRKSAEKSRA